MHLAIASLRIFRKIPDITLLLGSLISIAAILASNGSPLHAGGQWPPQPDTSRDALIDRHALAAPRDVEQSLDGLARYLARPARNDRDKARAIFRWLADRLKFDVNAHLTEHPGEMRPEVVLRDREATGFGYAALFEALARRSGLEALTIQGYAKLANFTEEGRSLKVKHAWNAVKIDGVWQFVDTTWGSGFLKGQRWQRVFQEQYFLTAPTQMVLTHLPADPRCQLLSVPVSPAQFDALPAFDARFFRLALINELGWQRMDTPDARRWLATVNAQLVLQTGKVKILYAPQIHFVPCGRDCPFVVEAPDVAQMALCNNGNWFLLNKNGTRFEGIIRPEAGEMKLCLQRPQDANFQTVVSYKVIDR